MPNCKGGVDGKCGKGAAFMFTVDGVNHYRCEEHKTPECVQRKRKMCAKCEKVMPSYGIPGTKTALYCGPCAAGIPGLVQVRGTLVRAREADKAVRAAAKAGEIITPEQAIPTPPKSIRAKSMAKVAAVRDAPIIAAPTVEEWPLARKPAPAKQPKSARVAPSPPAAAAAAAIAAEEWPVERAPKTRMKPRAPVVAAPKVRARDISDAPAAAPSPIPVPEASIAKRSVAKPRACLSITRQLVPDAPADCCDAARTPCYCFGCGKKFASFGKRGGSPSHCKDCMLPGMIDVLHLRCPGDKCTTQASYFKYDDPVGYCASHKPSDEYVCGTNLCEHPECFIFASFGVKGTNKRRFCIEHKEPSMVCIGAILCVICNKTRASYAHPGERRPLFCEPCAPDDAVSTDLRKCDFEGGCATRPSYGFPGDDATRCKDHVYPGMVELNATKCNYPGCDIVPTFGFPSEPPTRCVTHKEAGMKDRKHKGCDGADGCPTRTTFKHAGFPGKKFCLEHAPSGSESINKKCEVPGCTKRPAYGYLFQTRQFCGKHAKSLGLANTVCFAETHPTCAIDGCKTRPSMTQDPILNYPTHCEEHATDTSKRWREISAASCRSCNVVTTVCRQSGLCAICEFGERMGPGAYHKVKESRMHDTLNAIGIHPVHDRQVDYATVCGVRKRPDFFYDCGRFALIIECDEFQHARRFDRSRPHARDPSEAPAAAAADAVAPKEEEASKSHPYDCDCELSRMIAIHQVVGMPTIFIRYNPDKYTDADGRVFRAATKNKRDEQCARYAKRLMEYLIAQETVNLVGLYVIYFCYDGVNEDAPIGYHIDYIDHILEPWSPC